MKFINSKISIWEFYEIPQMTYFNYSEEEKSKMFIEYHKKLVEKFYGNGENLFIVWLLKLPCL